MNKKISPKKNLINKKKKNSRNLENLDQWKIFFSVILFLVKFNEHRSKNIHYLTIAFIFLLGVRVVTLVLT